MEYARKTFYRDREVADGYFAQRFTRPKAVSEHNALAAAMETALAAVPAVRSILDLPSGVGRFTNFFSARGCRYFAADVSKEMLDVLAREKGASDHGLSLVQCDGERLPFKDDAFDCVVCIRLFHLIPRAAKELVAREMRRVSSRWLLVEVRHVKWTHRFHGVRMLLRKAAGGGEPELDPELTNAGWSERKRVRVKGTKHWVGLYQKNAR